MNKTIFRVVKDKENPYVILNKMFLNDSDITAKAKGILSYLLSLPDDWKIYEDEVITHFADGRDSIRKGIKELINYGYIEKERIRNEQGQFKACNYSVYEISTKNVISNVGEANIGEPTTTNNDLTNNNLTNNKNIYISVADAYSFSNVGDAFYDAYTNKFKCEPRVTHKTCMDNPTFDDIDDEALEDILNNFLSTEEIQRCTIEYLDAIVDRYR